METQCQKNPSLAYEIDQPVSGPLFRSLSAETHSYFFSLTGFAVVMLGDVAGLMVQWCSVFFPKVVDGGEARGIDTKHIWDIILKNNNNKKS